MNGNLVATTFVVVGCPTTDVRRVGRNVDSQSAYLTATSRFRNRKAIAVGIGSCNILASKRVVPGEGRIACAGTQRNLTAAS